MGFVSGGGNIAIATPYPHYFNLYGIVSTQSVYWINLSKLLHLPEVSVSGCGDKPRCALFPLSAEYSVVMCGVSPGI